MTNTTTPADIVRTRVSAMRKEAAVAEAAQRSQARRSALTEPAESGGTALHAAERKHKPVDIDLAPLVANKKAEEAAYAEGFCKAAEVAGVDPVALCKKAQALKVYSRLGALLSRARVGAQKGGKRYLELLRGGRPRFIEQMRQGLGVERLGGPLESTKPLERLLGRLRAGRSRIASRVSRIKGGPLENPADVTEARKALAVQLGTGAGVAGAGTGLYGLLSGNEGD